MFEAVVLLGGNAAETLGVFERVVFMLDGVPGRVIRVSSLYSSASWGYKSANDYWNMAVLLKTSETPQELMSRLLVIEQLFGRQRVAGCSEYSDRVIDLDLLCMGCKIVHEENLHLPHPRLHERRFVLIPLKEVYSSWIHPGLNANVEKMLSDCRDSLRVEKSNIHVRLPVEIFSC
jgi:deoxyguanosine kinase